MAEVEICVESADGVRHALAGGATRVELSFALSIGGVTPSAGAIEEARAASDDVFVMIRPRAGDFYYEEGDVLAMEHDVDFAREAGVRGIVIGALCTEGTIDVDNVRRLIERRGDLSVTFHRAFDYVVDPLRALDTLIELDIDRLLTSGQARSAPEGAPELRKWVDHVGDQLTIVAGGGVRAHNVGELIATSGVREVHASAGRIVTPGHPEGPARLAGGTAEDAGLAHVETCTETVRALVEAARA